MSHKYLNKIQELDNNELVKLLVENGYDELKTILNQREINGGEFLELTELKILKWKLTLTEKRKLWACLDELKKNPQTFFKNVETKPVTVVNRNESLLRQNNKFKKELELVFGAKPADINFKSGDNDNRQKLRAETPPDEYLPMEKPIPPTHNLQNINSHYDENGYLIPVTTENSAADIEENDYEPPPSEKKVTNFRTSSRPNENSQRKPLALPRCSTDDRGYIIGPSSQPGSFKQNYVKNTDSETPPPRLLPRIQPNPRAKSKATTPVTPTITVSNNESESEEEQTYEPAPQSNIDAPESETSRYSPQSVDKADLELSENSTLKKRILGFLTRPKNRKTLSSESNRNNKKSQSFTQSLDRKQSLRDRPLPELPKRKSVSRIKKQNRGQIPKHPPNYENVPVRKISNTVSDDDQSLYVNEKSKSDTNLPSLAFQRKGSLSRNPTPDNTGNYGNLAISQPANKPIARAENTGDLQTTVKLKGLTSYPRKDSFSKNNIPEKRENYDKLPTPQPVRKPEIRKDFHEQINKILSTPPQRYEDNSSSNNRIQISTETYGNLPIPQSKYPESYERVSIIGKGKLPLPPSKIFQFEFPSDLSRTPADDDADDNDDEGNEEYDNFIFNLNNEPFYRNTDRKGARQLLENLEDGAFLFRPSRKFFLSLSIKFKKNYFNLGVEKTDTNKIRLNTDNTISPEFSTLSELESYFSREPITLQHEGRIVELVLKKALPHDRF